MVTVTKGDGNNPGLSLIQRTEIADVRYLSKTFKPKKESEEVDVIQLDFLSAEKSCFASMNSYRSSLANIILDDEGGRTLGSFLTEDTILEFPKKGILYSGDVIRSGETNGTKWTLYKVHLKGVRFSDFIIHQAKPKAKKK